MNRMAISSILDELWTEWPSFWMNYEHNGYQFHFGWTMTRMVISSILDELWTEWSSNFCDCTRSMLDELWTEQPSVSFWMKYGQNGYQLNLHDCTSSILDELWTEWPSVPFWMNYGQNGHQFHFGWIMDRMTTPVPFWINWCSSHGGSFTLVTHLFIFKFMILQSWFENWVWFHIPYYKGISFNTCLFNN
jgi:hypothetical protein